MSLNTTHQTTKIEAFAYTDGLCLATCSFKFPTYVAFNPKPPILYYHPSLSLKVLLQQSTIFCLYFKFFPSYYIQTFLYFFCLNQPISTETASIVLVLLFFLLFFIEKLLKIAVFMLRDSKSSLILSQTHPSVSNPEHPTKVHLAELITVFILMNFLYNFQDKKKYTSFPTSKYNTSPVSTVFPSLLPSLFMLGCPMAQSQVSLFCLYFYATPFILTQPHDFKSLTSISQ